MGAFRLLVAGSRTYGDYEEFTRVMDFMTAKCGDLEIVHGAAKGADSLAARYANEKGIPVKAFPADWKLFGKQAGFIRNREMHKYIAESGRRGCLLFWDGESKGTKDNIGLCEEFGTPLKVFNFVTKEMT